MSDNGNNKHQAARKVSRKNRVCPHKFSFMMDNPLRRLIQNPAKILGEYIKPGDTVVDIGCGPGFFAVDMAKMAGENGTAIVVDMQAAMLESVRKKARRKGVEDRLRFHQCAPDRIGLSIQADFILAFYMVHETPNAAAFFREAKSMLKKDGKLLVVEPKMHVGQNDFEAMLHVAKSEGLDIIDSPDNKGGRSVLLSRRR